MTDRNISAGAPKKARWSTAKKSEARQKKSARRSTWEDRTAGRDDRRDRPARDGCPRIAGEHRPVSRDDRTEHRPVTRDERGERRREERPRFGRDERRPVDRDDERGERRRPFDRDERRPFKRDDRDERRPFNWDDRGQRRSFSRDDRGERRSFNGDDRRERRSFSGDDRGERPSFSGDDRGERRAYVRDERVRVERDERPARQEVRSEPRRESRQVTEVPVTEDNGFLALGVPDPLVRRLARDGIAEPFPIQVATIPDALAGRDVLGRGRTGSGKTLSFGLPMLARLAGGRAQPKRPRALVLVPTRELAMQVSDALQPLVHVMGLRHKLVAGGMPYPPQFEALDRGVDVLIATPGRLTDLVDRGAAVLDSIEIVVLDEADHMAEMGFLPEVTGLLDLMPAGGQRLLFSATLDRGVDGLVQRYLVDPVTHSTDDATASVTTMAHHILLVEPAHKKVITAEVANRSGRTVVFVRTKLGADRVAEQLREQGVFAAALHGGLNQGARNRVLSAFKDGTLPVLVATDVAARGIHVDDVSVVLQVDPPADHKDYLHRAGRTARAGEEGTVVTLALPHQRRAMERIADAAGLDARPVRVRAGDDTILAATGARSPSGRPIPDEQLRRIMEAPRHRRGPGGHGGHGGHGGQSGRFNRGGGPRGPRRDSRDGARRESGGPRRVTQAH